MRRVLYRVDRGPAPATRLPLAMIGRDDGWCDDPSDPRYNRQIRLPAAAGAERLWRDDHIYDAVVVLGHNSDPVIAGAGSAIFLHIARPGFGPTEGCVALDHSDLLTVLAGADLDSRVCALAAPPD
jgi:L,D-peptidoglycan transpeptidase YkuD (ErfK/YbiS/YcfS/YnhG family)